MDSKVKDMKFNAVLHGADPKDLEDKNYDSVKNTKDNLMFGDPAEYSNMTDEERKVLSDKMMNKFIKFAKGKDNG